MSRRNTAESAPAALIRKLWKAPEGCMPPRLDSKTPMGPQTCR